MTVIDVGQRAITVASTDGVSPTQSPDDLLSSLSNQVQQATATSSDEPFFPTSTPDLSPPASSADGKDALTKSVVAFVVLGLAVLFILLFFIRTILYCRRNNITLAQYFSTCCTRRPRSSKAPPKSAATQSLPRTTGLPPVSGLDAQTYPLHLPSLYPSSDRANRRTTAGDIDLEGRRLGPDTETKDAYELPAYDHGKGGPPKYKDLAAEAGGDQTGLLALPLTSPSSTGSSTTDIPQTRNEGQDPHVPQPEGIPPTNHTT